MCVCVGVCVCGLVWFGLFSVRYGVGDFISAKSCSDYPVSGFEELAFLALICTLLQIIFI